MPSNLYCAKIDAFNWNNEIRVQTLSLALWFLLVQLSWRVAEACCYDFLKATFLNFMMNFPTHLANIQNNKFEESFHIWQEMS